MLGKFVRVRITNPVGSLNRQYGYRYSLNFGSLEGRRQFDNRFAGAYIMGVHHPVRHFDGRAIAVLYREGERKGILVVAPKNMRFIGYQIADALAFAEPEGTYRLECLYERSCGAVVCRRINGEIRLLLIKNSRSAHWGFPKGHMERGETPEQTARRDRDTHRHHPGLHRKIRLHDSGQGRKERNHLFGKNRRHRDDNSARRDR